MGMLRVGTTTARKTIRAGRAKNSSTGGMPEPSAFDEKYGGLIAGTIIIGIGLIVLIGIIGQVISGLK